MKLTKEDFMRLPKERLADLLVELQEEKALTITTPTVNPKPDLVKAPNYCSWAPNGICEYNGLCSICPRRTITAVEIGNSNTLTDKNNQHAYGKEDGK